jgi:alkylation response protein AidB-like acyl-CoA dehydrogenase
MLEAIATAGRVVAVAVPSAAHLVQQRTELELRADATVAGCTQVLDLTDADVVLLPVGCDAGIAWAAIDTDRVKQVARLRLIDGRSVSTAEFLGPATLITAPQSFAEALTPVLSDGAALVSAWLLGLSERAFELTLDYLKVREQFGEVIGSYQALQHRAARLRCELVVGRATVEAALYAHDANRGDRVLLAAAAKARMGELALRVTGEAIQLHGGIGMTEEANIGLLFKAARIADLVGGHHLVHKRRAAAILGLDGSRG